MSECSMPRGFYCTYYRGAVFTQAGPNLEHKPTQISPLDIEINEGLFDNVVRMDICIGFTTNHTGGEEPTQFRIYSNGLVAGTNVGLSPSQFNEIIRTRSALGWDGKE